MDTLSLRTPSPSLLYHCIASLYHSEGTVYSIAVSKGLIFTGSGAAAFVRGGNQAAWNIASDSRKFRPSLEDQARFLYCFREQTTNNDNTRTAFLAWLTTTPEAFCTLARMTEQLKLGGCQMRRPSFCSPCLAAVGNLVFSGSEDTTIRIWKREEGNCLHECLAVLEGHRGPVRCLAACLEMGKVVMGFLVYSASLEKLSRFGGLRYCLMTENLRAWIIAWTTE
ncbi:hypothetical protein FNV43_RR12513 [Rhamnella rubrinervis]|uniref:Uncharacterized protein n=1 Tax=Rhamnella rubrinervis TaxID=2594499 RepID=A0A8K0H7L3_9ROSA|nr:hypothetical protein FNV43_RR12513 [Rhamnella rubrinervis]